MANIYKIVNDINSKVYVGQTHKTIESRFNRHCAEARWKAKKKMPIVRAIHKYGAKHFRIELLESLDVSLSQQEIDAKELEWGLKLDSMVPNGYNLRLGSGRGAWSEQSKRKISKSNTGKVASAETRQRLSISHMGQQKSPEQKKHLSDYWKGTPLSSLAKQNAVLAIQKTYALINPLGEEIIIINMAKYCREHGYNKSRMCELVRGQREFYRGWTRPK